MKTWLAAIVTLALLALAVTANSASAAPPAKPFEFLHLVAHWDQYGDQDYVDFIGEAKPEVAQLGFYGAHFYSLAHTSSFSGYPAHLPKQGIDECGAWFEERNRQVHAHGAKVVGHFNIKFLMGDPDGPEGPRGFFKFYRDLWNEKELGPKPVANALELLEVDAAGKPIVNENYKVGGMNEYWGCLINPHWRTVLKAWTKRGIERGVDGYMINYFYRHNCLCTHCQHGFKSYLAERFTAEELKAKFNIAKLAEHKFAEIVAWHDAKESTPLRREMLRFSQIANKKAFDEVFVEYGRSLKPDLIVGQWNHLGDFNQVSGDERSLLPGELWSKDESYLWYSTGGAACFTDLEAGFLGDGTLQARYIRGASGDKPFTLGKYEQTRIRATISELAANGGTPMGFYCRQKDPLARAEFVRYYRFMSQHADIFRANKPYGEAVLLYPRAAVHAADLEPLARFRTLGKLLLEQHRLFDVLPDDETAAAAKYPQVFKTDQSEVTDQGRDKASRFAAPKTVRVSASQPAAGAGLDLHFVNYNRTEPEQKRSPGGGIKDEKPIATEAFDIDVALSPGFTPKQAKFLTPEQSEAGKLGFSITEGRLKARVPGFLVYAVVSLRAE